MEKEMIELYNTGMVMNEYVKNSIHAFCGAVLYECKHHDTNDIDKAFTGVYNFVSSRSNETANGIKGIHSHLELLGAFFNQKNMIPGYIMYWFNNCYMDWLGYSGKGLTHYTDRHYEVYQALQRKYIGLYRKWKQAEKEEQTYFKETRRKICKMYRSGEYSAAFKLYNTPLFDDIPEKRIKDIAFLMPYLFPKGMNNFHDDESCAAFCYIIGRIQGLSEAETAARNVGNELAAAVIEKISACKDKKKQQIIYNFVSNLLK